MSFSQSSLLSNVFQQSRNLNKFYISRLKDVDPFENIEFGGQQFNSIYWITAHLVWAENFLIVSQTGGDIGMPEWLEHYSIHSKGTLHENPGTYKELLDLMNAQHSKAMAYLESLSDEDLAADNTIKMSFGGSDVSKRLSVVHAIRHESTHTGHLGWICKMKNIKTV